MALSVTARGNTGNNTGSTSVTISPSGNLASGSRAVLFLALDNSTTNGVAQATLTVSDTKSNTWTRRVSGLNDPGAANAGIELGIWETSQDGGALTTGDTITVSWSTSATAKVVVLQEIVGSSVYSSSGTSTQNLVSSQTITTGTIASGSVVFGVVAAENGNTTFPGDSDTTNGSWSSAVTQSTGVTTAGVGICVQSKVVSAAGTQTYNMTLGSASADLVNAWISFDEASTSYTLTASGGSFSVTGTAAGLKAARRISAGSASYSVSGTSATLRAARRISAASGSFAVSGTAATLRAARKIAAAAGSFAVTGTAAALRAARKVSADSGSFAVTGTSATLAAARRLASDAGSFAITGADAILRAARRIAAEAAAFLVTGSDATLTYEPDAGTLPDSACVHITAIDSATVGLSFASASVGLSLSSPTVTASLSYCTVSASLSSCTVGLSMESC